MSISRPSEYEKPGGAMGFYREGNIAAVEQSRALLYVKQLVTPNLEVSGNLFQETTWMLKLTAQHDNPTSLQIRFTNQHFTL
jgi:hypothetical protein